MTEPQSLRHILYNRIVPLTRCGMTEHDTNHSASFSVLTRPPMTIMGVWMPSSFVKTYTGDS